MGLLEEYGIEKGGFLEDQARVAEAYTALAQVWGKLTDQPLPQEARVTADAVIYEVQSGLTLEVHLQDDSYGPKGDGIFLVVTCPHCGSKGVYEAIQYWLPVEERDSVQLSRALRSAMEHPNDHACYGKQVVVRSEWNYDPESAMASAAGQAQKEAGHRMRKSGLDIVGISTTLTPHSNGEGYTATCVIALER